MSDINEFLETLLKDTSEFAAGELKTLIENAKSDSNVFIRQIGDLTEEFIKMRAQGEINNDEFKELMEDLVDLGKMEKYKLKSDAKVKAEKIANGIADLVLKKLIILI